MLKKGILLIGTGILVIGALTVYSVEVKGKEQIRDNGNYTINKVLSSYEGEEFFTTDYVDEMFNNWSIDENTKVIADEEGGLFYSLTDNHAVLKTYDTDSGQVVEELSLDSPRATTVGELKEALYEALEEW